jgi:signal transduction histidine kinase
MATEAVAWLGLFGADWQHTINQKIFGIRNYVNGMKNLIEQEDVPTKFAQEMVTALEEIEKVADNIRDVKFTSHVPAGDIDKKVGQTKIDEELPKMVNRWASKRDDVKTMFRLNCPGVYAQILPQWLAVAMEKLINNALKAMEKGGQLTISTSLKKDEIYIDIHDTGKGIPGKAQKDFLKRAIQRRPGEEGGGMGALIARFVVQSHGGDLLLVSTGPDIGTHLLMKLPIVKTENHSGANRKQEGLL